MPKENKETKKEKSYIAKAPIRRLMKREGATLVSEKAVEILIDKLRDVAKKVSKDANKKVKDEKRKRITKDDIIAITRTIEL